MLLCSGCPKSVSNTWWLAALKWWLELASLPTTCHTLHGAGGPPPRPRNLLTLAPLNDRTTSTKKLLSLDSPFKYAVAGGYEALVGISSASYDLMHAHINDDGPLPRFLRTPTWWHHFMPLYTRDLLR